MLIKNLVKILCSKIHHDNFGTRGGGDLFWKYFTLVDYFKISINKNR